MVSGERLAFLEAAQGKDVTWASGSDVKSFGKFRMHQRLQNHVREAQKHVAFKHRKTRLGLECKGCVFPSLFLPLGRALV